MKRNRMLSMLLACLMLLTMAVPAFASDAAPKTFKNLIFMIGDGMGENHLELAKEQGYTLFCDANADLRGQSQTRSFSDEVTDSAAGATALSCGVRTTNRFLCTYPLDPLGLFVQPRNITEVAKAHGMKTGIVTTDKTSGATPAGYSSHVADRSFALQISYEQLGSGIDLIWGAKEDAAKECFACLKGVNYITTKEEMDALEPGERSFGQFSGDMWKLQVPEDDPSPTLEEMSVKAIELLNTDNDKGFFLMIEGAHIDKNSHRTENGVDFPEKIKDAAEAMKGFDNAIKVAADFAREDGQTLVVVTADHETGDLYMENGRYTFHAGDHTGKNVPVLVFGADDLFEPGEALENRQIPVLVAERLGWCAWELPKKAPGKLPQLVWRILTLKPLRVLICHLLSKEPPMPCICQACR